MAALFKSFFSFPSVKAQDDDEIVDPQAVLRERCHKNSHVSSLKAEYEECSARVSSKKSTLETCVQEFFDYLHELDHCVGQDLFKKLK